jgi:hypothetical protein
LWEDGVLTGVVDWSGGAFGPRGFDVGWCRLDLYLLYGDLLFWDLWAVARSYEAVESWVPNYRDLGRVDLIARELRKRHTEWTQHLIRALS